MYNNVLILIGRVSPHQITSHHSRVPRHLSTWLQWIILSCFFLSYSSLNTSLTFPHTLWRAVISCNLGFQAIHHIMSPFHFAPMKCCMISHASNFGYKERQRKCANRWSNIKLESGATTFLLSSQGMQNLGHAIAFAKSRLCRLILS